MMASSSTVSSSVDDGDTWRDSDDSDWWRVKVAAAFCSSSAFFSSAVTATGYRARHLHVAPLLPLLVGALLLLHAGVLQGGHARLAYLVLPAAIADPVLLQLALRHHECDEDGHLGRALHGRAALAYDLAHLQVRVGGKVEALLDFDLLQLRLDLGLPLLLAGQRLEDPTDGGHLLEEGELVAVVRALGGGEVGDDAVQQRLAGAAEGGHLQRLVRRLHLTQLGLAQPDQLVRQQDGEVRRLQEEVVQQVEGVVAQRLYDLRQVEHDLVDRVLRTASTSRRGISGGGHGDNFGWLCGGCVRCDSTE